MGKVSMPSFTKVFHHKPYPAIDPTRPELSAKDKVVVITGAGSGIGRAAAIAFAQAGASVLSLVGRNSTTLRETQSIIKSEGHQRTVVVNPIDVTNEKDVHVVFENLINEYGNIDVLVHCAGHLSEVGKLSETSAKNFWDSFDVNVKASFLLQKAFLDQPNSQQRDRLLICVNSMVAYSPAKRPGFTPASYGISKLAQAKLVEYIAAENAEDTHFRAYALHPGIVDTYLGEKGVKMGPPGLREMLTFDDPELCGRFFVWLASPRGACVPSGKYLWANWDVEELEARADELKQDNSVLTQTMKGWPFPLPEEEQ